MPAIRALHLIPEVNVITEEQDWVRKFPGLFQGLGTLGEEYTIRLRENATPFVLSTPCNVPLPLREKVKKELERMEQLGVVRKVQEHTPWCAAMVVVPKSSGKEVRFCVDLKALNENVLRENHPIPAVEDSLAHLHGARLFSKVDANSGFWQVPLSTESQLLTTFITPYGRYCFRKLPFGISSAPELFQNRMNCILEGFAGVLGHMDDVLIHGKTEEEHDAHLQAVLEKLSAVGITLNLKKCEFNKTRIKFLGHIIDQEGIHPDPQKIEAIQKMEAPTDVSSLRRFMGMVQQLGRFIPNLSDTSHPLRELLSTRNAWVWGPDQDRAFSRIKEMLTKPATLSPYSIHAPTKVSADASSYGLGAILLQQHDSAWKPVAYASRTMSDTEVRYAQIEKEALAVTWACEKFSNYILGKPVKIETDHKPLVPLLNSKRLDILPPRVLRFRLRLARYTYVVEHVPGKLLYTADTLSRAPVGIGDGNFEELQGEVVAMFNAIVRSLPATHGRLEVYKHAQREDSICSQVMDYCITGWPNQDEMHPDVTPYW